MSNKDLKNQENIDSFSQDKIDSEKAEQAEKVEAEVVESDTEIEDKNTEKKKLLKVAFERVLKDFDKNISEEILYSNISMKDGIITATDIITIAKKIGLNVEMRRINVLDIKSGPCILMLKDSSSYVFLESDKGFNPETGEEEKYNPAEIIKDYIGYALFFFEEDLTVSTFVKKTSFLFSSLSNFKPIFIEILVISFFINVFAATV